MERDLRSALHSEVRVALVCDRQIFLQQDLHHPLSGRKIVDLPPIAERERWDVLRDPEPASSTVAAALDYQMIGVLKVAVPLDLLDAPGSPDFSAVRLDDGERWLWWLRTIPPAGVHLRETVAKSTQTIISLPIQTAVLPYRAQVWDQDSPLAKSGVASKRLRSLVETRRARRS